MPTTTPEGIPYLLPSDHPLEYPAQSQQLASKIVAAAPPGILAPYAGAAAPTGWLICDGAAVSRTTYAALFAAIGVVYGVGDGSSTFNLPNLKGRIPAGLDAGQTEFASVGKTGGAKTHVLAAGELPAHTHPYETGNGGNTSQVTARASSYMNSGTGVAIGNAITAANTGGGAGHNNLQPYLTMPYIIKT